MGNIDVRSTIDGRISECSCLCDYVLADDSKYMSALRHNSEQCECSARYTDTLLKVACSGSQIPK